MKKQKSKYLMAVVVALVALSGSVMAAAFLPPVPPHGGGNGGNCPAGSHVQCQSFQGHSFCYCQKN